MNIDGVSVYPSCIIVVIMIVIVVVIYKGLVICIKLKAFFFNIII